jgi:hypothetical protein
MIADFSVGTQQLTDASVTTAKIAGAAVTPAKLANGGAELGWRNRIINGAIAIDQRNAGASVSTTTLNANVYTVDRWAYYVNVASKFTVQQNAGAVTPPAGFSNYLGITSTSAYSVASGDFFGLRHPIEGTNCSDLAWGTASAQAITLSFRVYSSLTGTFGGVVCNNAGNRTYPFTYTVSSANAWTYITITIPGDTAGTWLTTNGVGIYLILSMGAGATYQGAPNTWASAFYNAPTGAVNVVGTSGATFYITGVQLEAGSTATPFERRSFGTEFALCQRYYNHSYTYGVVPGTVTNAGQYRTIGNSSAVAFNIGFPVEMRAVPTVTAYNPQTANTVGYMAAATNTVPTAYEFTTRGGNFNGAATTGSWALTHYTAVAEL